MFFAKRLDFFDLLRWNEEIGACRPVALRHSRVSDRFQFNVCNPNHMIGLRRGDGNFRCCNRCH